MVKLDMKLAVMQPYLLPYLGYFQLASSVDNFVIYDNIQYTKRGWINRNRYLRGGQPATFTVPLQQGSSDLEIRQRFIADNYNPEKLLNQFVEAYRKARFFDQTIDLLEQILKCKHDHLFEFLHHSLQLLFQHLSIDTSLLVSSQISANHEEAGQARLISICHAMQAKTYVNPVGGRDLYAREEFAAHGIQLQFFQFAEHEYPQFSSAFVERLSIIDALMFNSLDDVRTLINAGTAHD